MHSGHQKWKQFLGLLVQRIWCSQIWELPGFFEKSFCTQKRVYSPAYYNRHKRYRDSKSPEKLLSGQISKKGPSRICYEQDKTDAQRRSGKGTSVPEWEASFRGKAGHSQVGIWQDLNPKNLSQQTGVSLNPPCCWHDLAMLTRAKKRLITAPCSGCTAVGLLVTPGHVCLHNALGTGRWGAHINL